MLNISASENLTKIAHLRGLFQYASYLYTFWFYKHKQLKISIVSINAMDRKCIINI